jgi:hypothetical protein
LENLSADNKYWLKRVSLIGLLLVMTFVIANVIAKGGIIIPVALIGLPFGLLIFYLILSRPKYGIISCFVVAFVLNGLGRYIIAPFGLALDIILILTLFAAIFSSSRLEWQGAKSPVVFLIFIWFGFTLFEIFNPEATSFEAWFYAVRGIALYMAIIVPLMFVVFYRERDYDLMITFWFVGGIISALYGMKQLYIGLNAAENAWLASGASETHILFGRLRVFSFYSDAGQFGAFMGFTGIVATIRALGKVALNKKVFYAATAVICFYGMAISGTRGALFVPVSGFFAYLFLSKNFKVLILGCIVMGSMFFILKYTFIGQGNYQIQRMRSALDPQDPSFQVRLENQRKYKEYLRTRPFGGGIGTAGYWGQRFSPGTFLAETPTDSHYVRIWAETGIVGLTIHLGVLISIMGISFFKIFKLKDPEVKQKLMAIFAGCFGIVVASYGNQVIGQMPTSVFFCMSLSYLYIGCSWPSANTKQSS